MLGFPLKSVNLTEFSGTSDSFGSRRSEVQILSPRLMQVIDLHYDITRRPAIDSLGVSSVGST